MKMNFIYTWFNRLSLFFAVTAIGLLSGAALMAQPIKVACVGNSVTFGYKIENREVNCYPAQLQRLLGDQYLVGNFGKSGATLLKKGHRPYMEQQEFKDAVAFEPDVVIVSLGLNDTDPRNWPNYRDDFVADYMALIESFKRSNGESPEIWIGKMTPIFHPHPRFKSGTRDWFWQIQETVELVAQNAGAHLIDWHTPLYVHPNMFPDALHPVKEGAAIMAKVAYQHVTGDFGGLQTAPVFNSHMVLQRNVAIPVWGTANAGETVTVQINGLCGSAIAGVDGKWRVTLPALAAGGPYELSILSESGKQVYQDVMMGEVWLCAGQSNMAFPVSQSANGAVDLKKNIPASLRLLHYQPIAETNNAAWDKVTLSRVNDLNYLQGQWAVANADVAASFSAIAWYFGNVMTQELGVAVGLIQLAVGGSPTEAWIDRNTLELDPQLVNMLYDWQNNDHTMEWCRERAATNIKEADSYGQRHPYEPAYLFESGISRVAGFPIKGVLWYQGESNAHHVELHEVLLPAMVDSWRNAWDAPELPFYFAQLSSLNRPSWPNFRDSQRLLSHRIAHASMVVTSDVGDANDVHPKQKKVVGERFAHLALRQLYHDRKVPYGNISIDHVQLLKGSLQIAFSHSKGLLTSDGAALRELEVAGRDGIFYSVQPQLKRNKMIIDFSEPIHHVRYGWKPYSRGNLVNEQGVPMSTFQISYPFNKL